MISVAKLESGFSNLQKKASNQKSEENKTKASIPYKKIFQNFFDSKQCLLSVLLLDCYFF
jgi:hypothetical protein